MSNTVIGIDLGTATTEAAVVVDGQVKMIPNPEGQFVTPSVVGVDEGGSIIVGERAKAQYLLAPERTAIEVKRSIGTGERISLGRVSYSPVELSAMLLSYVKRYASDYLGEEVSRAVISVPAYFDDLQRQEVVQAGIQAGFTVERIINEPTAAALSYGLEHLEEERFLLVYDLGGGTFDVTLLELFEGVLDVKASAGDNHLGGKDFDEYLMGRLQSRFEAESRLRLGEDSYARARLKEAAEGCKIALSTQTEARVQIPMLASRGGVPLGLEDTVTRADFEAGIQPLLNRTHAPIRRVLEDAGLDPSELQGILLVGGSTRIPLVSADIQQLLGKAPDTDLDPDFSVAKGAAIQAAILAGTLEPDRRLVMTDVCAYTLGIRAGDGRNYDRMSVIIPRNTTIPTTRQETYYTASHGQTVAKIEVYQGESTTVNHNHFLGSFELSGIPAGPAGKESLLVSFAYNLNGLLDVTATIQSTGKAADLSINLMDGRQEAQEGPMDVSGWQTAELADNYRSVVRRGTTFVKKLSRRADGGPLVKEMEGLLYELKRAVLIGDEDEADLLEEQILDLIEREG